MSDSIWKKEISFGRKRKPEAEEVQADVADAVKAVLAPPPDVQPEPSQEPPAGTSAEPVAAESAHLPGVTGDYGWLTSTFDPNDVPENMPTVTAPLVSLPAQQVPAASTVPALPAAAEPAAAESVADPQEGASSAEAGPPSGPFWKKELSFSRGARTPKAAKTPKPAKTPKSAKAAKMPKAAKQPNSPKEKAAPFWKKDLSFRSKQPKQAVASAAAAAEPKVKEKKPPLWKRELKLSMPKLARGTSDATEGEQATERKLPRQKQKGSRGGGANGALVGLKIGSSQVAAARVSNNGPPQLLQVARAPLAEGIVVGGELRDIDALAETLKELFAKHKLPKRGVRLGIANNRIGVRTFEVAGISDQRQLANAIRFRAQETLPIPLEEAVLDWQVLSEHTDDQGVTTRRVLLVVAYRELVDQYVAACKKAGIRLSGIDLEAFAMLRALTIPPAADAGEATAAQVLVNVGHDRSTFAVTDGTHCEFTRVLGWGGHSLSSAIAGALEIGLDEATPIKHQTSLVANAVDAEGVDPATLDTAREAVRRELQSFARELVSSLRFYQNQPGSLGIGEVILTGGTAHLPGFGEELNRLIGVPVRIGDPLNRVAVPKKFRQSDEYSVGSLTVAIGLGIED